MVERGVLALRDGLPINRADGSYVVGFANPAQAESIEVYRGYLANRLGASVLGGAFNFISPTGASAPGTRLMLSGGSFGQLGASCGGSGMPICAYGFQCDTAGGTPGVCQPLTFTAASGATCRPSGGVLCQAGLVCALVDDGGDAYQCEAPVAAGAACHRAIPSACPTGSVCVVATGMDLGTCQPQGLASQPCLTGGGVLFGCAPGLTCDFDTDVCVTLVDNGAACTVDDQCGGACSAGVCAAPGVCD